MPERGRTSNIRQIPGIFGNNQCRGLQWQPQTKLEEASYVADLQCMESWEQWAEQHRVCTKMKSNSHIHHKYTISQLFIAYFYLILPICIHFPIRKMSPPWHWKATSHCNCVSIVLLQSLFYMSVFPADRWLTEVLLSFFLKYSPTFHRLFLPVLYYMAFAKTPNRL